MESIENKNKRENERGSLIINYVVGKKIQLEKKIQNLNLSNKVWNKITHTSLTVKHSSNQLLHMGNPGRTMTQKAGSLPRTGIGTKDVQHSRKKSIYKEIIQKSIDVVIAALTSSNILKRENMKLTTIFETPTKMKVNKSHWGNLKSQYKKTARMKSCKPTLESTNTAK